MLHTGLVSISFRKLSAAEIVDLVKRGGLEGIEWGGDIHAPHGDVKTAREVLKMTEDAGLKVAAYGSYYGVGCEDLEGKPPFEKVLESAVALKAPTIRVWAGNLASAAADSAWWDKVVSESARIAEMAEKAGITVSYEYHANTLTDTNESAYRLLNAVNHRNMKSYWQPPISQNAEEHLFGLNQIIPWLTNVHVYHWVNSGAKYEKLPLAEGKEEWGKYMDILKKLEGDRYCMLEFVRNDTPEQFLEDAAALKQLIG